MEQKADNGVTVSVDEEDPDTVVAIVSSTGVKDEVGDVIEPGAYTKTLLKREAQPVWSHAWSEMIGATKSVKELMPGDPLLAKQTLPDGSPWPAHAGGLLVRMKANRATDVGERAYQNIKFANEHRKGGMPWSIGYKATKSTKDKDGTRRIKELELYEYSPVLHGANTNTKTLSVKSLDEALDALHAGGYDTSELDVKSAEDEPFEGLDAAEIKQLATFADIVDAYLAEVGVKRAALVDEDDAAELADEADDDAPEVDVLPTLAARLEDVLVAEDYADLLDAADDFDAAVQAGDEAAIAAAVTEFMEVFEAEEAGDPDDPDAWDELRDVVGDALDDAHLVLYGERPDDAEDGDEDADEADGDDLEDDGEDGADEEVGGQSGDEHYESGSDYDSTVDAGSDVAADTGGEKRARRGECKEISQAERDKHASSGAALSDGSYPITSASQLRSAIRLRSQGNAPNKVVDAHIRKRAKTLGLESMLPDDLKASGDSGGGKDDGKKWALPDLEFGGAVDDIMAAIDFGDARV